MNYQLMRKARKVAKITQDDLATLLGVNRATISRYETGVIEPPAMQQLKIAQILDIDLFALMDDDAIQDSFSANERRNSALEKSGTITDQEGVIAPVDSYIGQFMQIIKNLNGDSKLDLLMVSEYFSETDREDQNQMLRFAAFLASHPKYRTERNDEETENVSEVAQFLSNQLRSLISTEDTEPPQD